MKKIINIIKVISAVLSFFIIRILTENSALDSFTAFFISEFISFFVMSFILLYSSDFSYRDEAEKIAKSAVISIVFTFFSVILTFFKLHFKPFIVNFLVYVFFISLPFIRDFFVYERTEKRILYRFYFTIAVMLVYKYSINVCSYFFELTLFEHSVFFALIPLVMRLVFSVVDYYFINGNIEFDDYEYPIFSQLKAGKSKQFDICIPDIQTKKNLAFTITEKKNELFVKPAESIIIDNKIVTEKTKLEDSDTIKIDNNYFTFTKGRGSLVRKVLFLFFYSALTVQIFAGSNTVFTDFSSFPDMNLYVRYTGDDIYGENVFITESDNPVNGKISVSDNFDIELFLILDITGNNIEKYKSFNNHSPGIFEAINLRERRFGINVISFADEKSDIKYLGRADNSKSFIGMINKLEYISGNDFLENPLDAVRSADISEISDDVLKIFILFTDAPPHQRGTRGKDGVLDFTDFTVEETALYLSANNILFFTASFERYTDYLPFYEKSPSNFYEIENIDDYGNVLSSVIFELERFVKISYKSSRNERLIKNDTKVFFGENALVHKKDNTRNRIRERLFLKSFFELF